MFDQTEAVIFDAFSFQIALSSKIAPFEEKSPSVLLYFVGGKRRITRIRKTWCFIQNRCFDGQKIATVTQAPVVLNQGVIHIWTIAALGIHFESF